MIGKYRYAALAELAVAAGVAGASAAGEFPKFPALRERAGASTPQGLVKFSGAGDSAAERRWADLLVCEHLALQALAALPGVVGARSARPGGQPAPCRKRAPEMAGHVHFSAVASRPRAGCLMALKSGRRCPKTRKHRAC